MSVKIQYSIILLSSIFVQACENVGDCGKREGDWVRVELPVDSFSGVSIYQNIDLEIIPSPEQKLELEFGENLVDEFSAKIKDGVLSLENLNSCNWTRSYRKPKVYLYTSSLTEINQFGFGNITNQDTLRSEKLKIKLEDASGDVSISGIFGELNLVSNGTSNITLNGRASIFRPSYYWNNGRLYAYNMKAETVILRHRGYNDLFIWANQEISGFIESEGHIYYQGDPSVISVEETWNGRLIDSN